MFTGYWKWTSYSNDGVRMELTAEFKDMYPFKSHFLDINGNKLHYLKEGVGEEVFVLVHGNPTWSFYYRDLIKTLREDYTVICVDHMGCGLSDKPQDYDYTLKNRINDLQALLEYENVKKFHMIVHDWGGAIGFGVAVNRAEDILSVTILNTAAFRSKVIPFTISLCKLPFLGPFIVKYLNAFCYPATFMTTKKPLSSIVKKGYLFPYKTVKNRIAISEFVQDIPLDSSHPSYGRLKEIEEKLPLLTCPKLILWGGKDFCFNDHFFGKWKEIYPEARVKYYENAGHYVIEDEPSDVVNELKKFLGSRNELSKC